MRTRESRKLVTLCDNGDWIAFRRACSNTATAPPVAAAPVLAANCEFGGISYASGSASCRAGTQYRCDNGRWSSLDLPCPMGDAPYPLVSNGRPCPYSGMTVASSSAICQSGTTFLCSDSTWINLGTRCW